MKIIGKVPYTGGSERKNAGGPKRRQVEYAFQKYTTPLSYCLHHALYYYFCCCPNPSETKLNFLQQISVGGKPVLKIAD